MTSAVLPRALARPLAAPLVVGVLAFALLLGAALREPARDLRHFDQPFYALTAWELLEYRVYGDGFFDAVDGSRQPPPAGMWLPPAYPMLLAALMTLDPTLRGAASCAERAVPGEACPAYQGIVVPVHMAFVAAAVACLFAAGRRLAGPGVAALAAALGLAMLLRYVPTLRLAMTESLALMLFAGASLALLSALRGLRAGAVGLGVLIGLLVLTRPSHVVLLPLAGLVLLGAPARGLRRLVAPAMLVLGAALVLLPWALRNEAVLGRFALGGGYGGAILTERMAWNDMTARELLVSFVYNLPDAGDGWAKALFGEDAALRLDWNRPGSFYDIGQERREAVLAAAAERGRDNGIGEVLRDQVLAAPLWHGLTTLSLAWRGVWIGRSLAFLMLPLALIGAIAAWRSAAPATLAVWLAPAWIMLAVHAAASVNQERYNLALVLPISLCAALGIRDVWARFGPAGRRDGA